MTFKDEEDEEDDENERDEEDEEGRVGITSNKWKSRPDDDNDNPMGTLMTTL